ncbi:MAG: hypothetical protein ACO2PN_08255 [Pyrobaculum sp.]|jgi:hypothetical protein
MWRTARGRRLIPLAVAVAIAVVSVLMTPTAQCQTPFCQLVYYTVTSTIVQTQINVAVEEVVINGTTTTTTRTYTTVVTQVVPGGVLANLSCSVPASPPPTVAAPSGPSLGDYPTDAFSLLMAAVAIGAVAAGIVSNLSRTVVYLFAAAAAVSTLAVAYPPLSAVAQATAAVVLFAAAIILALSR